MYQIYIGKPCAFDIKTVELEGPESSRRKTFVMNFMTLAVYLLLVLPLPLTLATGGEVSFERQCQRYFSTGCPVHDRDSWVCSKNITNCTSPDYPYHCILNTAVKVVHVCAAAQICPNGTVPIFDPMTRMVSCKNRSKEYFQPDDTWSNNTPICKEKFGCDINIHKIECTVEPEKEQNQDTLCRCDVRNDSILSFSEGREICVPRKFAILKCPDPDGQERLRNDTCVPRCEDGFQRNDNDICVLKSTVTTTLGVCCKRKTCCRQSTTVYCKGKICSRQSTTAQSDNPETGTMSNESCIRRLCNCQYRQVPSDNNDANTAEVVSTNNVPTDNNDANTAEVVSTNNAQSDAVELRTMNNAQTDNPEAGNMSHDTNENAASRERLNQGTNINAQPRDIPNRETPRPAQTDGPEAGTMSNETTRNATSRERLNQGTNTNAQPRDIPSPETPRPETTRNATSRERLNQEKLHRRVLNQCLPSLQLDLNIETVMIRIREKEIFDDLTLRNIEDQKTKTESISMLIEKVKQGPQDKYEKFKDCLVLVGQQDLKNMLEEVEEKITKEIGETRQA